jgi:hypothetical protein
MATIADISRTGPLRPAAKVRARAPATAQPSTARFDRFIRADAAAPGSITLGVMRAMIAASDAFGEYLWNSDIRTPQEADLHRTGTDLAEHVRRYQTASRQFIKDWLHGTQRTTWRVDASSGRTLGVLKPRARRRGPADAPTQIVLAEDQPLHGLRTRLVRSGIGIPVTVWTRRHASGDVVDVTRSTASRPMTAVVMVEQEPNESLRTVSVRLVDPMKEPTVPLAGATLPLAADFSAPVAHTLGMERRPATNGYGIRDAARRGTVDGFVALTPYAANRVPLVLLDRAGFSPLMMAQIANGVAGDPDLGRRFQVWLYQYPTTSPLCYAASRLRADVETLCARLDVAAAPRSAARWSSRTGPAPRSRPRC